jgi:hypothetical protein
VGSVIGGRNKQGEMMENKTCEYCLDIFTPNNRTGKRQRFCSDDCSRKWWKENRDKKKRYEYVCLNCGNKYLAKEKNRDKYCSKKCASIAAKQNRICIVCGKEFWDKRAAAKFCSEECKDSYRYICKCSICGREFTSKRITAKYCSDECRMEKARQRSKEIARQYHEEAVFVCNECGKKHVVKYGSKRKKYCSDECSESHNKKTEWYKAMKKKCQRKRRARLAGVRCLPYKDEDIFTRDGWVCKLCGRPVDKSLLYPNPMSATIDHVIPLAKQGEDTPDNVQLAHFICNSYKRDEIIESVSMCIPGA